MASGANNSKQLPLSRTSSRASIPSRGSLYTQIQHADKGIKSALAADIDVTKPEDIRRHIANLNRELEAYQTLSRQAEARLANPANKEERMGFKGRRLNHLNTMNIKFREFNDFLSAMGGESVPLYDIDDQMSLVSVLNTSRCLDDEIVIDEYHARDTDESFEERENIPVKQIGHGAKKKTKNPVGALASDLGGLEVGMGDQSVRQKDQPQNPPRPRPRSLTAIDRSINAPSGEGSLPVRDRSARFSDMFDIEESRHLEDSDARPRPRDTSRTGGGGRGRSGVDEEAENRNRRTELERDMDRNRESRSLAGRDTRRLRAEDDLFHAPEINTASFLARLELFKDPMYKFNGDRDKYLNWSMSLLAKMNLAQLEGTERLQVLQNHTCLKARRVVDTFANVLVSSPEHANANFKEAWEALRERCGSEGQQVESMYDKVKDFKPIVDDKDWFEIGHLKDLCKTLQVAMRSSSRAEAGLEHFNRKRGLLELALKLPKEMREDWHDYGYYYMRGTAGNPKPSLNTFVNFLEDAYDRQRNDFFDGLYSGKGTGSSTSDSTKSSTKSRATSKGLPFTGSYYSDDSTAACDLDCALHEKCDHLTVDCPLFLKRDTKGRFDLLRKLSLCYKCGQAHRRDACDVEVSCDTCKGNHYTALHRPYGNFKRTSEASATRAPRTDAARGAVRSAGAGTGGATGATGADERTSASVESDSASGSTGFAGCTPTKQDDDEDMCAFSLNFLIEVSHDQTDEVIECIAMLDPQAWTSFCVKELADRLSLPTSHAEYSLGTLSHYSTFIKGHQVSGIRIRNPQGGEWIHLPPLLTNEYIPEVKAKRATREVVAQIDHLAHLAPNYQCENKSARTMLLLGEDVQDLFWILSHGTKAPYAQETNLGWAVIGKIPRSVIPTDCMAKKAVQSKNVCHAHESFLAVYEFLPRHEEWHVASDIFETRHDDEEITWSSEDNSFVEAMKQGFSVTESGHIQLPLPLKDPDTKLPSCEAAVYHRTRTVLQRIKDNPSKLSLTCEAMQKNLSKGFVELVPNTEISSQSLCWWLPIFAVMHPRKPSVRLVFDASATFRGVSLNDVLYSGPDLNNSLKAVMLSFRLFRVAFSLDIEHMFNCFKIPAEQKDLLRFFWWLENDPSKPIVQYRSTVHLFGACSSCAVAMFALKAVAAIARKSGELSEEEAAFIENNFYIDDGMGSRHTIEDVVSIVRRVRPVLKKYGLNMHKVRSNSPAVVEALQDDGTNTTEGESLLSSSIVQVPRALGVTWDERSDNLHVLLDLPARPFTRRGLLATTNTAFDPIGIAAPVILGGRILQRKILSQFPAKAKADWDEPLPEKFLDQWKIWLNGVAGKSSISVDRCLYPMASSSVREIHVFADASTEAISAVAYARSVGADGCVVVRFLMGCAKLAPRAATTVPRLELCAALLAAMMAYGILKDLKNINLRCIFFYTDSSAVLGYLRNETSCFTRYITRRIEAIHRITGKKPWKFVATSENPADVATRPQTSSQLVDSIWLTGPSFLHQEPLEVREGEEVLQTLPETIPDVAVFAAEEASKDYWNDWVEHIRSWPLAVRVIKLMLSKTSKWLDRARQRRGVALAVRPDVDMQAAETFLFRAAQQSTFPEVWKENRIDEERITKMPADHVLLGLSPIRGTDDTIRVGGRLRNARSPFEVKHPVILPKGSNITRKYVEHQHARSFHQGRLVTLSTIRQKGVFVMGGKGVVNKVLSACVTCQRLRGKPMTQLMADLPPERVCESAPFEHVGVDVFGPYYVYDGKSTRRTLGSKKVFVMLVNCLASRAVHLEALEGMDTASMMNALRRFFSIRGLCKTMYSDHGSNFIGVLNQENYFNAFQVEIEAKGIE